MKAKMSFDLNDADDSMAHFRCTKALDMALALWNFSNLLRGLQKNDEKIDVDTISKDFYDILDEYGLKLDDLVI